MTKMSNALIPPIRRSELEEEWEVPEELTGITVNSFEELKSKFPGKEVFLDGKRSNKERFDRYSAHWLEGDDPVVKYIAYGCPNCKKIVIGPPKINETDMFGNPEQRKTYDCVICNRYMGGW
ncbi:hypothetical protein JW851_02970 [Candidatus Woesearchaeota archaeon]|nr:hypothetical protein [Candidatus Woesearchaeota archaeon]